MNNFEEEKISFGIGKAIFYTILAVFAMQIVGGLIQLPAFKYPILTHVLLPLGFFIGICAAIGLILGILKTNSKSIINNLKIPLSIVEIILGILIWIGFLPLCELLTTLIPTNGFLEDLYKDFESNFKIMLNYKVAGFITVCILAPIFEEILFRGIILKGMINHKINPILAIIIGGLIFGVAHLNPWQFVGAGLLGTIFGYVYYRTKSLVLPILLHALNNTVSYAVMMQSNTMEEQIFNTSDYINISIFSAVALGLSVLLYLVTKKKQTTQWN